MNYLQILFNAQMVKANHAGIKTRTSRVIRPQPPKDVTLIEMSKITGEGWQNFAHSGRWAIKGGIQDKIWKCPYGKLGDHLWVREGWYNWGTWRHIDNRCEETDHERARWVSYLKPDCIKKGRPIQPIYAADIENQIMPFYNVGIGSWDRATNKWRKENGEPYWRLRSSIHMPRNYSRTTLLNKKVTVERIQDISPENIIKEGISASDCLSDDLCFKGIWDSIYKKRGYGWGANPMVWAVDYEIMEG